MTQAIERLNAQLARAEKHLVGLERRVRASVPLGGEGNLVFCRRGDAWGLSVELANGQIVPLLSASREVRVLAAHSLDALVHAILDAVRDAERAEEEAVGVVEDFLQRRGAP